MKDKSFFSPFYNVQKIWERGDLSSGKEGSSDCLLHWFATFFMGWLNNFGDF